MSTAAPPAPPLAYVGVPLAGLVGDDAPPFPLFLRTAQSTWVLYHPAAAALDASHVGRLLSEGIGQLFIQGSDQQAYLTRIEGRLDEVLLDRQMPLERRAEVLHGVAVRMADELLAGPPDRAGIARAQKVMMSTSGLLLRETAGFAAIRKVMGASQGLATHSLTISFLTMGLARVVLTGDAGTLMLAGLAGLLHDVGKVGYEQLDHDPEHAERGAAQLRALGVPAPVVESARSHHERWDGTGFPQALRGEAIPELARVVGLCDTFDKVYSGKQAKVGVFDALRILAQAYRGCFDERFARGLIQIFR
jgi:putative nucleotidyltransferase with HDIG domain